MNGARTEGDGRGRRERRRGGGRGARGATERPAGSSGGGRRGPSARTTTSGALAAVGAYLANDLRDPEGLARPVLRRAAQALAASRIAALRRTGSGYLRLDPPSTAELEQAADAQAAAGRRHAEAEEEIIDATVVEVVEPDDPGHEGER